MLIALMYKSWILPSFTVRCEMNVTSMNSALNKVLDKRSIVISRSSYASLGRYAGHWSGDNIAIWDDLYYSIPCM